MSSICGIDIALWDLLGQAAGLPVWRLLGGHSNKVPVYADGIGYEDEDADRMAEKVAIHSGLGFSHVKIHLPGPDPDENVEKVRRSREALGPEKKLLLDAFRHWDGRTAARVVRRLLEYDLFWVEEPVRMDDELGYLRMVRDVMLGADTECYLAAGEGENTLAGVARLITLGGVQVIQTDPVSVGGYTGLMRVGGGLQRAQRASGASWQSNPGDQLPDRRGYPESAHDSGHTSDRAFPDMEPALRPAVRGRQSCVGTHRSPRNGPVDRRRLCSRVPGRGVTGGFRSRDRLRLKLRQSV